MTEYSADKNKEPAGVSTHSTFLIQNQQLKISSGDSKKTEKEFNSPIKPSNLPKKKPHHAVGIGSTIAAARERENKALPLRQLAEDEMNLFAMLEDNSQEAVLSGNKSGDCQGNKI